MMLNLNELLPTITTHLKIKTTYTHYNDTHTFCP